MRQFLLGLKFVHDSHLVHRDIKPENLFINCTKKLELKIGDFGLARGTAMNFARPSPKSAKIIPEEKVQDLDCLTRIAFKKEATHHVATRFYRPPEVSMRQQKRELLSAIDVWSTGCIFAELLQTMKSVSPEGMRGILFEGDADDVVLYDIDRQVSPIDRNTQLRAIFEVIGTPDKKFISEIKNK
eukprot:UN32955